jgi:hypothetical protein
MRQGLTAAAPIQRTGSLAWAAALKWVAPLLLALVVSVGYASTVGEYFEGNDTFAHIWTSLDVGRVLTQPIMAGTSFPAEWALFYRPASSLSYTLDYALFGLNALAFHLTDLVIHLLATFGLYGLALRFGLRPWAAALGAASFALHPVMASVVPDVPRRHDPLAMASLLGGLLLVARAEAGRKALLGSVLLLALAESAKEIAYVGVVLVAPTLACVAWSDGQRPAWRRVVEVTAAWSTVSLVLLGWRLHVLGDIGGYHLHMAPLFDLDVALNDILRNLLWPFRTLLQTTLRAWVTEIGLAVLIAGLPILQVRRAARATLVYGWLWLVAFGVFQGLSHSQAPWHTYFTVGGLGLLTAGVLDGALTALRAGSPVRLGISAVLSACMAGLLVFQVAALRESALFTRYTAWHISGELGREYLVSIAPCVRQARAGASVQLDNFPYGLDDSSDQYVLVQAGVFAPYALGPAVYLTQGRTDLSFLETGNGASFRALPGALQTTCADLDGVWHIATTYTP